MLFTLCMNAPIANKTQTYIYTSVYTACGACPASCSAGTALSVLNNLQIQRYPRLYNIYHRNEQTKQKTFSLLQKYPAAAANLDAGGDFFLSPCWLCLCQVNLLIRGLEKMLRHVFFLFENKNPVQTLAKCIKLRNTMLYLFFDKLIIRKQHA